MKLYEIAAEYRRIDEMLDESGGELTPELEEAMSTLDDALEAKIDAIGGLVREKQAEADALSAEALRFAGRAKTAQGSSYRLKEYVLHCLTAAGREKVKGSRFSARVGTASTPTIRWDGEGEVPAEFTRTEVKLDGRKCIEAERQGLLPEGFRVERTKYLDLR